MATLAAGRITMPTTKWRLAVGYPHFFLLSSMLKDSGTWFRCLVKMVREEDITEGDHIAYNWFEMGIFTRWDEGECKVLCVDTPDDLPQKLMVALEKWPF